MQAIVGLTALAIILTTLVARVPLPGRIPGALGAVLIAGAMYYALQWLGFQELLGPGRHAEIANPADALWPTEWLTVFKFEWVARLGDSLIYLPVVIPFALGTVVGGIDCTESAAAAGDDYDTRTVIGVEAFATLVASLCGGVIQTTPCIGHPAYKAMGGRAAYTLATAIFVGSAGLLGFFGYLYAVIPKATVFPILIFIGIEITAQSFKATDRRHYPAVVMACIPALATLALLFIDKIFGDLVPAGVTEANLSASLQNEIQTVRILANGFILTSLLWASSVAALIDRRLRVAAFYFVIMAGFTAFGLIHSPIPGSPVYLPWNLAPEIRVQVARYALGYAMVAVTLLAWSTVVDETLPIEHPDAFIHE